MLDRAPHNSIDARLLDGSASASRPKELDPLPLYVISRTAKDIRQSYGAHGDSIWGCRQTAVPPEYAQ
jgi:hypothetical protein